jgi:hypothetical protein
MSILGELNNIDFEADESLKMIKQSKEFNSFVNEIDFIEEVLSVLQTSDLTRKKAYFIENQVYITDSVQNMQKLLTIISGCTNGYTYELLKLINDFVRNIESEIEKFKKELANEVSEDSVIEKVELSNDTIEDAIKNNPNTRQIINNLKNNNVPQVDEKTAQMREEFNKYMQNARQNRQNTAQVQNNSQQFGYLIASSDFSEYKIVPGTGLSKDVLNKMIEKSGIDDAHVYQLTELPTHKKKVQKIVTVLS